MLLSRSVAWRGCSQAKQVPSPTSYACLIFRTEKRADPRSRRDEVVAVSKIVPRWICVGVVLAAVLASRPSRSESLEDAWNAALAANQGLAPHRREHSRPSTAWPPPRQTHSHDHHAQCVHVAQQRAHVQGESSRAWRFGTDEPLAPLLEQGFLLFLHADDRAALHGWPHPLGH